MEKTIVGIATPLGVGGIGIVRISGGDALLIARKMVDKDLTPRVATLCSVSVGEVRDEVIAIYFAAPNSYTGEDVIEIQAHGNPLLLKKIVEGAVNLGARVATAGEFTKRAFLNGKVALDRAESVADIINAESEAELKTASRAFSGVIASAISPIESLLFDLRASVEAMLDYPESIEIETETAKIKSSINDIKKRVETLIASAQTGAVIRDGIRVVIVGKPNVGKSTLFNVMLGVERSIITDISGTTTDIISETFFIDGVKICLVDTAGIRTTKNVIERFGVERSHDAIDGADLVLAVFDSSVEIDEFDVEIIKLIRDKNKIVVLNKQDLTEKKCWNAIDFGSGEIIKVSAKLSGAETVKKKIAEKIAGLNINGDAVYITNKRHEDLLKSALKNLNDLDFDKMDLLASGLLQVQNLIGEITGSNITEKTLDAIFSKFCLGK